MVKNRYNSSELKLWKSHPALRKDAESVPAKNPNNECNKKIKYCNDNVPWPILCKTDIKSSKVKEKEQKSSHKNAHWKWQKLKGDLKTKLRKA